MKRLAIVVVVVVLLGGLFLFGLLRGQPDRDIESARLGREMPSFALPVHSPFLTEYGSSYGFDPAEVARPMVVNFWATWCLPCRDEAPVLESAWRRYGDEVTILGIQTQDQGNSAEGVEFIREFGLTFPNVFDGNSRVSIDWGLFGVPETYFVRADGTLSYKHAGIVTPDLMEEQIGRLLQ